MLGSSRTGTPLILLGLGQIGRALGRTLTMRVAAEHDPHFSIVGLADRSGLLTALNGFSRDHLRQLLLGKEIGEPLFDPPQNPASQAELGAALQEQIFSRLPTPGILIDLTADETDQVLLSALQAGWSCVLANKKPLCSDQNSYERLFSEAKRCGATIKHSATVGIGLPLLQAIDDLEARGETIERIDASLSGTVAFILAELEGGASFQEAVQHAKTLGYTEPDPREDLSGKDVVRKALILARRLGRKLEFTDVNLQGLNEDSFQPPPQKGEVLRYLATIGDQRVKVGIEAVSDEAPVAHLRAGEQMAVIHISGKEHPIVLRGQGTGCELTSRVVLGDILAIARNP